VSAHRRLYKKYNKTITDLVDWVRYSCIILYLFLILYLMNMNWKGG
jgi:hypothetical protein